MDGGSQEAASSSGQLEDWEAVVAADFNEVRTEDNAEEPRRRRADQAVTSSPRQRSATAQPSATPKRARQPQERESSPEEDNEAKDSLRPKLPRPEKTEACPRCSSLDTKFCYYNNYNIKQPRFYCKACQRYWTSGGTLRNIAPGSGRRKSKSKASNRDLRSGSVLTEHLTAASVAQTGMFGLPVSATASYPALLAAASDPTGLLSSSAAAAAAYPQLLAGHSGLTGLKLAGISQLPGSWGSGLPSDAVLREHLQAQLSAGAPLPSSLGQTAGGLDARLLLNGRLEDDIPAAALALTHMGMPGQPSQQGLCEQGNSAQLSSPSASPPPPQQQQTSSPRQPNSQASQHPSPPQAHHHGSPSEDPDTEGVEVCLQGRRMRLRPELELSVGGNGLGLGSGGLGAVNGLHGSSSMQSLQLASLSLPPSMASLAAVMGPGGGPSSLSGNLHPLLNQQEAVAGGLLDGPHAGLSRHHLHLALQHHQAIQQQQESLQQLNGLLLQSGMTAAALQAQYPLLHGVGHQGGTPGAAPGSTAAAVAALDPLQRSALLHQAAGLASVGGWLQGGGSVPGVLPSAAMAAAALESLATSSASSLLQVPQHPSASSVSGPGSTPDWLSLAGAAAAKSQGSLGPTHPTAAAVAAAQTANLGSAGSAIAGAAHMLQAQAAAAANGGCGSTVGNWAGSGPLVGGHGGHPSWSLWSSYNSPAANNYGGYALHGAATAAAYSLSR